MKTIRDLSIEEVIERIETLYPDMELSEIKAMYGVIHLDDLIEILDQDLLDLDEDTDPVVLPDVDSEVLKEIKDGEGLGDVSCPFASFPFPFN